MYDHTTGITKLANHQIRHQATHKVVCQPGDYIIMVTSIFLKGLCWYVGVTMLIYLSRGDQLLEERLYWYHVTF